MASYLNTLADLGKRFGASKQTAYEWSKRQGAPERSKKGHNAEKWDRYLKAHGLGPYRGAKTTKVAAGTNGHSREYTLTEAKIIGTLEKAARDRIAKERELVQQQIELGKLALIEDVMLMYGQTVGTVTTTLDALYDAHDREIPENRPTEEAWPDLRKRILVMDRKLIHDIANTMQALAIDPSHDNDEPDQ